MDGDFKALVTNGSCMRSDRGERARLSKTATQSKAHLAFPWVPQEANAYVLRYSTGFPEVLWHRRAVNCETKD